MVRQLIELNRILNKKNPKNKNLDLMVHLIFIQSFGNRRNNDNISIKRSITLEIIQRRYSHNEYHNSFTSCC